MATKKSTSNNKTVSEHLSKYLRSSYRQRLNWLEEASRFVKMRKIRSTAHVKK